MDFDSLSDDQKTLMVMSLEAEANRLESLLREYGTTQNRKPTNPVVRQLADEGVICRKEKASILRSIVNQVRGKAANPPVSRATPQ
jgi:hypothetical protein